MRYTLQEENYGGISRTKTSKFTNLQETILEEKILKFCRIELVVFSG